MWDTSTGAVEKKMEESVADDIVGISSLPLRMMA